MADRDPLGSFVQRGEVTTPAPTRTLERALGHRFADRALLRRALTHPSAAGAEAEADFDRLEFLGDRVLGLVVADLLIRRFAVAPEGELARRFNALVRRDALADVAREIDLGSHLVLGQGEIVSGGRDKSAILADACEAVLGALYLDGGFDAARGFVERVWVSRIERQDGAPLDPKTALQEWSQSLGHGLPEYLECARSGPAHAPHFVVEVQLAGHRPARGEGRNKREAEHNAAAAMLARENVTTDA